MEFSVMLVGVTARQASSPTALFHARVAANPYEACLLSPLHGAFNQAMALSIKRWKEAGMRWVER
ncbi:hypothetical protein EAH79_00495 [Sphingomonas koreensis]|nr:hypothetical protein EAH79_00495 [Sphingomonas koreensis]